ncbi:MAG: CDGSH iron-sulfur domain-containing protein [Alphaproteobacteria bacterium]
MMDALIAQKGPFQVEVEAGEEYYWCACGRSQKQPYCDGSHKGTGLAPQVFKADKSKTVFLCGCKRTGKPPFCDGTHGKL